MFEDSVSLYNRYTLLQKTMQNYMKFLNYGTNSYFFGE